MFQASGDEEFTQLLSMTTNYPSWQKEFKETIISRAHWSEFNHQTVWKKVSGPAK